MDYKAHASIASADPNVALSNLATWLTGNGNELEVVGDVGLHQDTDKNYVAWAVVRKKR